MNYLDLFHVKDNFQNWFFDILFFFKKHRCYCWTTVWSEVRASG